MGGGDFSGVVVLDEPDETPPFSRRKHCRDRFSYPIDRVRMTMNNISVLLQNFRKVVHENHGRVGGGHATFFACGPRRRLQGFVLEDNTTPEELAQNDEVWIEEKFVRQEDGIAVTHTTKTREDLVRND